MSREGGVRKLAEPPCYSNFLFSFVFFFFPFHFAFWQYSGVSPGSALKNYSWWWPGAPVGYLRPNLWPHAGWTPSLSPIALTPSIVTLKEAPALWVCLRVMLSHIFLESSWVRVFSFTLPNGFQDKTDWSLTNLSWKAQGGSSPLSHLFAYFYLIKFGLGRAG